MKRLGFLGEGAEGDRRCRERSERRIFFDNSDILDMRTRPPRCEGGASRVRLGAGWLGDHLGGFGCQGCDLDDLAHALRLAQDPSGDRGDRD